MTDTRLHIFGAGLAGLIAARMLADRKPIVMEKQDELPNNHHAVLRFRSSVVGDVTNVPFKKVQVTKYVLREQYSNPIRDSLVYARKATDKLHARSILDTRISERYIAPTDFISRLGSTAEMKTGVDFSEWSHNLVRQHGPVISTMPMPYLMDLFSWADKPNFQSQEGWTLKAYVKPELECELYATIYSARNDDKWYRASLTGSELMIEGTGDGSWVNENLLAEACWHFGLSGRDFASWTVHRAKYQKITEMNSAERESAKRFIMWLSQEHGIYSLGRFATWRPKLLLDDMVNDVRVIARLIDGQSLYQSNLA